MSNAEVLDRAIGKANANGWKGSVVYPEVYESPEQLIYNHSFARALWGKEAPNCYCQVNGLDMWQYHLQGVTRTPARPAPARRRPQRRSSQLTNVPVGT
jgi:hypothetical protein